jgi:Asp-tRNA(Asn)/Glu-tRNA(Gln) amidotransferase B subunit
LTDDTLRKGLLAIVLRHPKQLAKYQQGQRGVHGFFVGQAMKQYGKQCNAVVD